MPERLRSIASAGLTASRKLLDEIFDPSEDPPEPPGESAPRESVLMVPGLEPRKSGRETRKTRSTKSSPKSSTKPAADGVTGLTHKASRFV